VFLRFLRFLRQYSAKIAELRFSLLQTAKANRTCRTLPRVGCVGLREPNPTEIAAKNAKSHKKEKGSKSSFCVLAFFAFFAAIFWHDRGVAIQLAADS